MTNRPSNAWSPSARLVDPHCGHRSRGSVVSGSGRAPAGRPARLRSTR